MTKVRVKNNRQAPYGIETVGGRYRFIEPGEERTVDAANLAGLKAAPDIETEVANDMAPPPASLRDKAAKVGAEEPFAGFLDRSVPAITGDLSGQPIERLNAILAAEKAGKSRKTLVPAIEAEIEARSQ